MPAFGQMQRDLLVAWRAMRAAASIRLRRMVAPRALPQARLAKTRRRRRRNRGGSEEREESRRNTVPAEDTPKTVQSRSFGRAGEILQEALRRRPPRPCTVASNLPTVRI
jgi:hypothetical protein